VETVEKPERLVRRLFQAAVEIIKEMDAEGHLIRFPSAAAGSTSAPRSLAFCGNAAKALDRFCTLKFVR
jgi:hypothetical protein